MYGIHHCCQIITDQGVTHTDSGVKYNKKGGKMQTQKYQLLVIFLTSIAMVGCERLIGPSPKEVLCNYLDASLKGRHQETYSYVSTEDKAVKDIQIYLKENENDGNLFAESIASKISYKIKKIQKSERNATVDVEITLPDFGSMFTDVMGTAFKLAFGGENEKEMEKVLSKKFESGEIPMTTKEERFRLVKEEGGWKVFLGW